MIPLRMQKSWHSGKLNNTLVAGVWPTPRSMSPLSRPCPMCAGALVQARVTHIVYGAPDVKAGAVHSLYQVTEDERLNHRLEVTGGVLATEAAELMQTFFRSRRKP